MSKSLAIVGVLAAITASACGATTRTTTIQTPASPTLTSASVNFISRDHGKDKDSALTVQLLKSKAELSAKCARTASSSTTTARPVPSRLR